MFSVCLFEFNKLSRIFSSIVNDFLVLLFELLSVSLMLLFIYINTFRLLGLQKSCWRCVQIQHFVVVKVVDNAYWWMEQCYNCDIYILFSEKLRISSWIYFNGQVRFLFWRLWRVIGGYCWEFSTVVLFVRCFVIKWNVHW